MARQQEIADRMAEIRSELLRLERVERSGRVSDPDEHDRQVVALTDEFDALDRESREHIARFASDPRFTEPGDGAAPMPGEAPYFNRNLDPYTFDGRESAGQVRSRALNAIEGWNADDELKEGATRTLERVGGDDAIDAEHEIAGVARHILRFSHPTYISAFRKFSRDPENYLADFSSEEARVWREARQEARTTLDTTGSVLPSPLDPTIVITNTGTIDPMRSVCRVDSTVALSKRYITSAGSTFSFDAELAEVSDDTFAESEVEITTRKAQGWIESSIETWMDQPGFSTEVARIIADGKARAEAPTLINGTEGSNQPNGIITRLDGSASEVDPAGAETFASTDVYSLIEALPPRWRANATWMAELSTLNAVDVMETTNGAKLFPKLGDANPTLLRRRVVENSEMDAYADVDTGTTADNFILMVGDFRQYVILDRVGLSVYFVPPGHLKNSNAGRPDGRVGWYSMWRVGADRLTINAFRVLNLATAA